jgi:hypothetical protein
MTKLGSIFFFISMPGYLVTAFKVQDALWQTDSVSVLCVWMACIVTMFALGNAAVRMWKYDNLG